MSQNRHEPYEELISASLHGDLTPDERRRLDAHLDTCDQCRGTLAAFAEERRMVAGLRQYSPPRDLGARADRRSHDEVGTAGVDLGAGAHRGLMKSVPREPAYAGRRPLTKVLVGSRWKHRFRPFSNLAGSRFLTSKCLRRRAARVSLCGSCPFIAEW